MNGMDIGGSSEFLSQWFLDFVVGMYVYTYPIDRDRIDFTLSRPSGFVVSEVVNRYSTRDLYSELQNAADIDIGDRCYSNAVYAIKKVALDSIEVCNIIKKMLRCGSCSVLGLKDSNAVAYQLIIVRGCRSVERHISYRRGGSMFDAHLWLCSKLDVIDLRNSFTVELRLQTQDSVDVIDRRVRLLKNHGYAVLNFFGYQRFGSRRPVTHIIGKKLVERDWDGFIEALCGYPFPTESRDSIIARLQWYENRGGGKRYPYSSIERYVCSKPIDNPLKTVKTIPRNVLQLYLNAYQSYLFNVTLSKIWIDLIERYGLADALSVVEREVPYIPIPGASTTGISTRVKSIVDEILHTEGISLNDFCIRELNICVHGDYRRSYIAAEDFRYTVLGNTIRLEFSLESSCYATVVLREILNADPLQYT